MSPRRRQIPPSDACTVLEDREGRPWPSPRRPRCAHRSKRRKVRRGHGSRCVLAAARARCQVRESALHLVPSPPPGRVRGGRGRRPRSRIAPNGPPKARLRSVRDHPPTACRTIPSSAFETYPASLLRQGREQADWNATACPGALIWIRRTVATDRCKTRPRRSFAGRSTAGQRAQRGSMIKQQPSAFLLRRQRLRVRQNVYLLLDVQHA